MKNKALSLSIFAILASAFAMSTASAPARAEAPTPGPSPEAGAACLNQSDVDSITKQFTITTTDKKSFSRCNTSNQTFRLIESLIGLKHMKMTTDELAGPFNAGILSNDMWGYFTQRANTIVEMPETDSTCGVGLFVAYVTTSQPGVVHICKIFYEDSRVSYTDRMSILLHEVRHFEGYVHIGCTRGPKNGQAGSCDQNVAEKGSYAVTLESLAKFAILDSSLTPVQKASARFSAMNYADGDFNEPVMPNGLKAIYLTGMDGKAQMLGADSKLYPAPAIPSATAIGRAYSLEIFPSDLTNAYTLDPYVLSPLKLDAQGTGALNYNKLSTDKRPVMIDIINSNAVSCAIQQQLVNCTFPPADVNHPPKVPDTGINATTTFKIRSAFSGAEVGRPDNDSIYVLSEDDHMYRVEFFNSSRTSTITEVPGLDVGFIRLILLEDGTRLGLKSTGEVLRDADGTWVPYAPLAGQKFANMTRPFYWTEYFFGDNWKLKQ